MRWCLFLATRPLHTYDAGCFCNVPCLNKACDLLVVLLTNAALIHNFMERHFLLLPPSSNICHI
jgi:hypothetical protein